MKFRPIGNEEPSSHYFPRKGSLKGPQFGEFLALITNSAAIDGCGHVRTFSCIALPLTRPATFAGALLTVVGNRNFFLCPLLVSFIEEWNPMPFGRSAFNSLSMQQTQCQFGFGMAIAAMTLLVLPTLFFFMAM